MHIADTLSRASSSNTTTELPEDEMNVFVHSIINSKEINDRKLQIIQDETTKDEALALVRNYIIEGCDIIKPYFNVKSDLSTYCGFITKGWRIVIPQSTRATIYESRGKKSTPHRTYWN